MKFAYTRNMISADFLTNDYRISCRIAVPAGGLHALLMDPLNSYLELEDAYISRVTDPGEIVAHFQSAAMRKENILYIILARREDGAPPRGAGSYLKSVEKTAFLTVPSFEIRGKVEAEPKAAPRDILVQVAGRFVPIYDATASVAGNPEITFGGKVLLVNKERVETLCIAEEQ